jgi:chorismate mutase/prephenate dehydratase
MKKSLDDLRQEINDLDLEILSLLTKRAEKINGVIAAKKASSDNEDVIIFDPKREAEIIRLVVIKNRSILPDADVATIFKAIIGACRNLQMTTVANARPFCISIQGDRGSYSEQALLQYCHQKSLENYKITYAITSAAVLHDMNSIKSQYGLVALNNSQGGLVSETIEALSQNRYLIIDSVILKVNHSILALNGVSQYDIKKIYSHPQALKQCREYLARNYPHCEIIPWRDTAQAASDLANNNIPNDAAVIASYNCANLYGLNILAQNIQDLGDDNETLFLIIKGANNE